MWGPKNLMEALVPILLINSILCHGVFSKSVNNFKNISNYSLLFSIITFSLYITALVMLVFKFFNHKWFGHFNLLYILPTIIYIIIMTINVISGWISTNEPLELDSKIIKADKALENLGIILNPKKEFYFATTVAIFWIFHALLTNIGRIALNGMKYELLTRIMLVFVFFHGHHVNFLIELRFYLLIKHMRLRYKYLNKALQDNFPKEDDNYIKNISIEFTDFSEFLINTRHIHLELGILCREIVNVYGTQIVFTTLGSFIVITCQLFSLFRHLVHPTFDIHEKILFSLYVSIWFSIACFRIFIINYICEETIKESKKTDEIVNKLEFETKSSKIKIEIDKFSMQILKNPLKFSPCGLFDLGFYFLKSFFATVTTYIMIMTHTYPHN